MDGTQHKISPTPTSPAWPEKPCVALPPANTGFDAPPDSEQSDQEEHRFLDRELSWLKFNERVLELAEDPTLPLLERANFLAIFAVNLDEFFMVRVAGLKQRIDTHVAVPSTNGLRPRDLIGKIYREAHRLQERHAKVFSEQIRPSLAEENVAFVSWDSLNQEEREILHALFRDRIFPILTPLAVDPAHPFPYISGLSMNLAILIRDPFKNKELFARVKVPSQLERFINIENYFPSANDENTARFISIEQVIMHHLDELFPGMEILERHTFRMTRNEDLELEEDEAQDLLETMEKELMRRRFGSPVRLEIATDISPRVRALLIRELEIEESEVYDLPAPLDLRGLSAIAHLNRPALRHPRHNGGTNYRLKSDDSDGSSNIFAAMRRRDILLHHPYDSFSTSVLLFLEQAATDPRVRAVKQTLYRTSGNSPIVDALVRAAENGKQVLALVEIKARFDEQANIAWARTLEHAGVHVVYGIVGLKTHAKLSLVVRQEADGLRRYCHLGTGNYHPSTARTYEDYGLLTSDPQVGEDLSVLFNQLSGYAVETNFRRFLVAPHDVRTGLIKLIEQEARNKKAGKNAKIQIKVNSLVDEAIIDSLYQASRAGVEIEMIVRGPCALRPGVPGLSENIRIYSVLGRFLEHSRIFAFHNAGEPRVYIGSADMMHRNLDHRIEVLVLLKNKEDSERLIKVLDKYVAPETSYWRLDCSGNWHRNGLSNEREDIQQWFVDIHQRPHGEDDIARDNH